MEIKIGTRASKLAMWQAEHIRDEIKILEPHADVSIVQVSTKGDRIQDRPLAKIGGKGLFTKEIEESMLQGESNFAVHSLKDVPVEFIKGFHLAAVTKREDPRDCFLSCKYKNLDDLPKGAVVGSTSLRRQMLAKIHRPDLNLRTLRGNVQTRIDKLRSGDYDAIILATAGINRLGIWGAVEHMEPIDTDIMIPSMGQAALGIELRDGSSLFELAHRLNDQETFDYTQTERSFIKKLEGGCSVPIGIYAREFSTEEMVVDAIVGLPDGSEYIRDRKVVKKKDYFVIGEQMAEEFIDKGAKELLAKASEMAFE